MIRTKSVEVGRAAMMTIRTQKQHIRDTDAARSAAQLFARTTVELCMQLLRFACNFWSAKRVSTATVLHIEQNTHATR